ncbi:uncharacterized protein SRS1_13520 [Sporisorium reilianum f. sp. reilianum]|uniref:Wax synthase domain-containing protein n=1 Tax=Sporisorium reilianum f. sp. reilianum TaxID=72559 RepID=A0A2N8UMU5_9BASI|nr:uncharacterized protein SRS1_13520 [Sporisorium reilianum f. sp. reilianum]
MPTTGAMLPSWLASIITWAVPDYHDKKPYDRTNAWILAAPLVLILLQIHLLIRYDPASTWLCRASLIPIITLLAFKSAFGLYYTIDQSGQMHGRGQALNATLGCAAVVMVIRSLENGLAFRRPQLKVGKTAQSKGATNGGMGKSTSSANSAADEMPLYFPGTRWPLELDLLLNVRAIGWQHGIKDGAPALPVPTYTWRERWHWIAQRMADVPVYFLLYDAFCVLLDEKRFNVHVGNRIGGSIWDCTRGSFGAAGPYLICIAFASMFVSLQCVVHAIMASLSVGLLGDLPSRWDPPITRVPWMSTSIAQFWSHRWHQMLRVTFMTVGYWPVRDFLRPIAGRRIAHIAAICGTFLASGIIHEVGRMAMVPGFAITSVTLFFAIQPLAVFGEQMFERCTGRRVRGFWGWLWCVTWILGTAPLLIEGYNQAGFTAAKNQHVGVTRRPIMLMLDWWDRAFNGM